MRTYVLIHTSVTTSRQIVRLFQARTMPALERLITDLALDFEQGDRVQVFNVDLNNIAVLL